MCKSTRDHRTGVVLWNEARTSKLKNKTTGVKPIQDCDSSLIQVCWTLQKDVLLGQHKHHIVQPKSQPVKASAKYEAVGNIFRPVETKENGFQEKTSIKVLITKIRPNYFNMEMETLQECQREVCV